MKQHGRLTSWNDAKGFGFIRPTSGGPQVFAHISAFPAGPRRPVVNEFVTYRVARDPRQRLRAENVLYRRTARRAAVRPRGLLPVLGLLAAFFGILVGLAVADRAPYPVVGFYALMSCLSFFMYARDKSAARRGAWRTPESTLQFIGLAGGWPGALLAQRLFRHKTGKKPFQLVFWFAAVANCAGLFWLLQAEMAAGLRLALGIG